MPMVIQDIKEVVAFMRSERVSSFKLDGLEVEFQSSAAFALGEARDMDVSPVVEMTDEQRKLEEENLLFHSAG